MAHLWVRNTDKWEACELVGKLFDLALPGPFPLAAKETSVSGGPAWLIVAETGGPPVWGLIVSDRSDVRVNGQKPPAGLAVLSDRDEIRISAAEPLYFSTETLAAVVPFPGLERAVFCGRCRQPIESGAPAVCCPRCGIWFHQAANTLPCWTYSDQCSLCGKPTSLDAGFSWVPED
jgi:hypothetical protein